MKLFKSGNMFRVVVLALLFVFAVPFDSWAQGRGRRVDDDSRRVEDNNGRRDRDWRRNHDWRRDDKKCEKFVNCHDARDGRLDGRGPRRTDSLDRRFPTRRTLWFSHKHGRRRVHHNRDDRERNRDGRDPFRRN
jgi:hypothetical protein